MSNAWALRGIKAILRNKRVNKPRLKDRSWQLKLRQKNRYITALENKNERLESEIDALRRSCRTLGHQIGRNQLNAEIFDLLVNGNFTGSTSCAHEPSQSGRECEQIICALKEAALNMPKLSPYPPAQMPFKFDGQQGRIVLTEKGKNMISSNMFAAFISCDKGPEGDGKS